MTVAILNPVATSSSFRVGLADRSGLALLASLPTARSDHLVRLGYRNSS